ncbi:hypothetical protein A8D61_01445 [Burkholderia cenocepacia]|nr:hypothetical protein A8D61_01445 [Burkholderia cenocepacia]AQQ46284.1 hypothetical protein A8F32_10585 [Burkholderia cenocepacia]ARF87999.1 uncharacterized protein BCN122_II1256 [Burkholderia cenocepacia]ONI96578.1 hypothetical protein A8F33_30500 [Burkholderia cenocepacia]ONJ01101.1 hypothetical protein A8F53_13710 [Burkholderia cenocepacia]
MRLVSGPSSIRLEYRRKSFFYQSLFFGTNVDTSDVIQSVLDHRYRRAIFMFGNIEFIQH